MSETGAGKIYLRLLRYLLPFWKRVIILFICTAIFASLSGVSLTLITPFLHILFGGGPAVVEEVTGSDHGVHVPETVERRIETVKKGVSDLIYKGTSIERRGRFCMIFLLLMITKNIFGYLSTYLTINLEQHVLYRIRNDLYERIQMLPMSFFDRQKTGHLISRITNDVQNLRGVVVGGLASIVRNGLMALIAISIVFYTSWKLSLLTIVLVPLNIFLITVIGRKLRKGSRRAQERMADITSVLQETISGIRVVKAFIMERFENFKFNRFNERYRNEYLKMRRMAELASPMSETLGTLASLSLPSTSTRPSS